MNYANVGNKRFAALIIDVIILSIFQSIITFVVSLAIGGIASNGETNEETIVAVASITTITTMVIIVVIYWLYYAIQESSPKQATIGKQAMGLVVTDMNGEKVSFPKASIRFLSRFLSGILLIGYIMAFFTEKKQALHDMIAGTLVLQK